jgi:Pyridoxamine 5'-phosphate oxidase
MSFPLPPDVERVFAEFRTCEFTTLAKDGTPITWPTLPFYDAEARRFIITTSVAFPQKAFNVRRNPRVSLLFSDPTASGLTDPPAALVQGDAEAPDVVDTSIRGYEDRLRRVFQRQPSGGIYSSNPLMRRYFDWYYMRLQIIVTPRRIRWWPMGDFTQAAREITLKEVPGVPLG